MGRNLGRYERSAAVKLSSSVTKAVTKAGVEVYFADRRLTKIWNMDRVEGEPIFYGGWYWIRSQKGKVVEADEDGPFKSESAAIRDAFKKLQLRPFRHQEK